MNIYKIQSIMKNPLNHRLDLTEPLGFSTELTLVLRFSSFLMLRTHLEILEFKWDLLNLTSSSALAPAVNQSIETIK